MGLFDHAESWDCVLPRILTDAGNGPEDAAGDLLTLDFLADLRIGFVLDQDDSLTLLRKKDLPPGMDIAAIYALARKNLAAAEEFTLTGTSYGGYGILAGGEHESAALCLDFIWDAVTRQAGGDLVLALPARDVLLMAEAADQEQVAAMRAIARDIFDHSDAPLSKTLLLCRAKDGAFSVYGTFDPLPR